MQTTNTVHITVRTFTGNSFHIDVDPTRTVGELKPMIVAAGKENSTKVAELEYKGHELRDSRRFDHYGLATNDVVDVVLPSQVPKISLALVREDGSGFDITVSSGITVAKLKEEIKFEEKITVRQLKLVNNQGDEDGDGVVTLLEMQDGKSISYYSLEGQKILVNGEYQCLILCSASADMSILVSVGVAVSTSSAIGILVLVDNRIEDVEGSCIGVAVRLDQTLDSFKELLLNTHCFHCAEHSLILNGLELKDDEQTLGDLGFVEGCTVDAGK
ncbi:hypothetical protein FIBSPDRAFT_201693 [Athelia psychrophila]|uniref:Ubiquitin-like domain-containing protein n=1 Tax=Athelia psychrophila TaxID=1759441 RepID=A0A165ZHS0_9AGAM|nr:hypothetical protein FIBSPDRAFT_201693 [Fibularhizoctonia sp. CBS 109695]